LFNDPPGATGASFAATSPRTPDVPYSRFLSTCRAPHCRRLAAPVAVLVRPRAPADQGSAGSAAGAGAANLYVERAVLPDRFWSAPASDNRSPSFHSGLTGHRGPEPLVANTMLLMQLAGSFRVLLIVPGLPAWAMWVAFHPGSLSRPDAPGPLVQPGGARGLWSRQRLAQHGAGADRGVVRGDRVVDDGRLQRFSSAMPAPSQPADWFPDEFVPTVNPRTSGPGAAGRC